MWFYLACNTFVSQLIIRVLPTARAVPHSHGSHDGVLTRLYLSIRREISVLLRCSWVSKSGSLLTSSLCQITPAAVVVAVIVCHPAGGAGGGPGQGESDQGWAGIFILYLDFIADATLGALEAFANANSNTHHTAAPVVIVPGSRRTVYLDTFLFKFCLMTLSCWMNCPSSWLVLLLLPPGKCTLWNMAWLACMAETMLERHWYPQA